MSSRLVVPLSSPSGRSFSLLLLGAPARLLGAAVLSAGLWGLVAWSLG
ncbi:hypothetical protein [Rhodospirillum rubrum]|nr:hypothetical protein [Rhodospirillum rubrum]